MTTGSPRRTWVLRVAGVALAVGVIYLIDANRDRGGESSMAAAGVMLMLVFVTGVAGVVSGLIAILRVFRGPILPALYRRTLYVFVTGNIALLLDGWWPATVQSREEFYVLFSAPIAITAIVVVIGAVLEHRAIRAAPLNAPNRHA
jgi:hypothetical protein